MWQAARTAALAALTQRVYTPLTMARARQVLKCRRLGPASLRLLPKQASEPLIFTLCQHTQAACGQLCAADYDIVDQGLHLMRVHVNSAPCMTQAQLVSTGPWKPACL